MLPIFKLSSRPKWDCHNSCDSKCWPIGWFDNWTIRRDEVDSLCAAQVKIDRFPRGRVVLQFDLIRFASVWQEHTCTTTRVCCVRFMCTYTRLIQFIKDGQGEREFSTSLPVASLVQSKKITLYLNVLKEPCDYVVWLMTAGYLSHRPHYQQQTHCGRLGATRILYSTRYWIFIANSLRIPSLIRFLLVPQFPAQFAMHTNK